MADASELSTRARAINRSLGRLYPGTATALCALQHDNAYELLIATILSAQCTDERVNAVVPAVFARYREPEDLANCDPDELEELIHSIGFFHAKARNLIGMAQMLIDRFGGIVPDTMEDLVNLPGVGRKTANVVLSVAYGKPGLPVDTHVLRLSRLLGLATATDPVKVEAELCALVPKKDWGAISLRLILHGRAVCIARRPQCDECILAPMCPSAHAPVITKKMAAAKGSQKHQSLKNADSKKAPAKKSSTEKLTAPKRRVATKA